MKHLAHVRIIFALMTALLLAGCSTTQKHTPPHKEIIQIGLVWLKKPGDAADRRKIMDAVQSFGREIPEVLSAAAGPTDGIGGPFSDTSYDVAFILTFKDQESRERYNHHPVHQKAAQEVFLPLSQKILFYRFLKN